MDDVSDEEEDSFEDVSNTRETSQIEEDPSKDSSQILWHVLVDDGQ